MNLDEFYQKYHKMIGDVVMAIKDQRYIDMKAEIVAAVGLMRSMYDDGSITASEYENLHSFLKDCTFSALVTE